jgi:hypothetical protein
MSKWVNDDLFGKFQDQKKEEKENPQGGGVRRMDIVWQTPEKGTDTVAKTYKGRFLPDPKGEFYKQYYYHMYRSGEKWVFTICPKTDDFENFCPFCSVTSKLYTGSAADKKMANNYKRKRKYVSNFFIQDDPRDAERDDDAKVNGTVKLYEFPNKVEMKLKEEITDPDGLGISIFDPGTDGYDFILKVMSTKKDDKGNSWPDYSNSKFDRRPDALGDDEEINRIMGSTYDINDYLDQQRRTEEELIKLVKDEMLFDMISDEYDQVLRKRQMASDNPEPDDIPDSIFDNNQSQVQVDETPEPVAEETAPVKDEDDSPPWNEDDSDEALLKELEGI